MKKDKELTMTQVNDDEDYDDVLWGDEDEIEGHYHFTSNEVSFLRSHALRIWNENGVEKWQVISHSVTEAWTADIKGQGLTLNEAIQNAIENMEKPKEHKHKP